ncbi:hypothetical protein PA598K_01712 [Paenibacillus sp. 598K]|uniref:hypothetical protein n=1 Tax=Paenibacillus sp. 598K TaxID=1117987 RepID=UPI000FF91F61|nr:hypothetical protein [Paenibacillus sp. 598K]GBF73423.1 hypothetical protein PA598K_01712 [Paenibacillus sp. 598K]
MGSYRDLEGDLRGKSNVKILILDTGNIQFLYQNEQLLPKAKMFEAYDMVLIPSWIYAEYEHHSGKVEYVSSIPSSVYFVDESEDYLPLSGFKENMLFNLFRIAAPFSESQKFFNRYKSVDMDDLPEDWIKLYYEHGFFTRVTDTKTTKKNAGEVSILTLAFLLLNHYPSEISNISIATSDYGVNRLKNKVLRDAPGLNLSFAPPLSFLSKDVILFQAIKSGIILPDIITSLRTNPKTTNFVEHFSDGSSTIHETVLETPDFIEMCSEPDRYTILF